VQGAHPPGVGAGPIALKRSGTGADGILPFTTPGELRRALADHAYLADEGLATALYLGLSLDKPLLLEGEAGVGKTEVAKVLAELLGRELIRLQCYEGIDASQALYEWDYSRQLVAVRMAQTGESGSVADIFGPEFLVERPLLAAIRAGSGAVLLIDELDRADDEFEAFLLEVLSEFAVTVPEIGRVGADRPPAVVITSNRTRELHDALKRRCLYHWIDHPSLEREVEIVRVRAPGVPEAIARQVAAAVGRLRQMDVAKRPGVAETIDWANAVHFLAAPALNGDVASTTLGAVIKDHEDERLVRSQLDEVISGEDA
jgi:MoxR-like ATPase